LVLTSCLFMATDRAAGSVWTNVSSGGNWSNSGNWVGGVPNGIGAVADFGTLNITADNTVHLDQDATVSSINFADTPPSNNWTIDDNGGTTYVLTLSTGGSVHPPTITVANQTANLSAILGGTQGFVKIGSGTLILSGIGSLYQNQYT